MKSPLNIDEFELFFAEKALKGGLSIFQRKRIKSVDRSAGGEYVFRFKGKKELSLSLKKKRNKIISYSCSCIKANCEHICAAIFYLTKDELILNKTKAQQSFGLNKKQGEILFNKSCVNLENLIEHYLRSGIKQKADGDKLALEIIRKGFLEKNKKNNAVINHLSVINEFSKFLPLKKFENGESSALFCPSVSYLSRLNIGNLNDLEKEAWIAAAKNSVRNNTVFKSGAFAFLIPVASFVITEKQEAEQLNNLLHKRYLKQQYSHYLDLKLIAQLQLLHRSNSPVKDLSAEQSVAMAELKFCAGKKRAGFKLLTNDYEKLKKLRPVNFINYTEYIIDKANELNDRTTEIYFIKEVMICDIQITPKYLNRVKELLQDEEREKYVSEIIKELKKKAPEIHFDKVAQLLESENRLDELVALISKQENKFSLFNRIAIKKLPGCDSFLTVNYVKHFVTAVSEARETFHQKQILDKALVYLDQLPNDVLEKMLLQMLEKISKSNFIYRQLKKYAEKIQEINLQA